MLLNILYSIDVDAVQLHCQHSVRKLGLMTQNNNKNPYFIQMTLNFFCFTILSVSELNYGDQ